MDWDTDRQDQLCEALESDCSNALVDHSDKTLLAYAVKLTRQPQTIVEADVVALRTVGFDDRAIHDICCIVAYFAFVNRIADGLGVELEDG